MVELIIMPSNHSSPAVHYLAGKYPEKIGWLISPDGWRRTKLRPWMPYACDNGAFTGFDAQAFVAMLDQIEKQDQKPLFICVPDKVADAKETNRLWAKWYPVVAEVGRPAFVAQDGHDEWDVPAAAEAVFVGGSTDWKLNNAARFKGSAPWFHIGRVNSWERLTWAESIGADSVDGTGFFRSPKGMETLFNFVSKEKTP